MARVTQSTAAGISALMPYTNTILGAIEAGATVAQIWQAVQAAEAEGGPILGNPTIFDMNEVAGRMRAIHSAQLTYDRADPGQAVTADMIANAPWADQSTAAFGEPSYLLRYQYEAQDAEGNVSTLWGQTDWQGAIDVTVGDIADRALGSAQSALDTGSPGAASVIGDLSGATVNAIIGIQILRA